MAFIGGSITNGAEIVFSTAWSRLTADYLASKYRSVFVRDLSIPGTGSPFAAYRVGQDLGTFVPDMTFIEFAANDGGLSRAEVVAHTDAIIYQLRRRNPKMIIFYVATTHAGDETIRRNGGVPISVQAAQDVSLEDQVEFIDVGAVLWAKVFAGDPFSKYIGDTVHPNDVGHRLYFETVKARLETFLPTADPPPLTTTRLISATHLDDARMTAATTVPGCPAVDTCTNWSVHISRSISCTAGQGFTFDFTGTTLGFVTAATPDTGILSCLVDGGARSDANILLPGAANPPYPFYFFFYKDLKNSLHHVDCIAKAFDPTHNRVVIGQFLTSSYTPITP